MGSIRKNRITFKKGICHAICQLFKKLKRVLASIRNSKINGSVLLFKAIYLGTEIVSCCLMQRMARMKKLLKCYAEWSLNQQPMRPKAEQAIDSKTMRARGIIVLVKSTQLIKNIETKQLQLAKRDSASIVLVFKAGTFRYQWAITYSLVVAQAIRTQH